MPIQRIEYIVMVFLLSCTAWLSGNCLINQKLVTPPFYIIYICKHRLAKLISLKKRTFFDVVFADTVTLVMYVLYLLASMVGF